jgi:hypothetical protein
MRKQLMVDLVGPRPAVSIEIDGFILESWKDHAARVMRELEEEREATAKARRLKRAARKGKR